MNLRIHGDNIVECERTLHLIQHAYKADSQPTSECVYFPAFSLTPAGKQPIHVELFAGHDRWGITINDELAKQGAPLREAADSYVTLLENDTETLLFAVEYCNALPAGNNAWQRSGRAITCAEIGIPYLYFAEIGGVELDAARTVKAPRFPNPIVPFSYLTASKSLNVICIPIYQAHPAINGALREKFTPVFGYESSLNLIKCLIENSKQADSVAVLENKGLSLVQLLVKDRKRADTFRDTEWDVFLKLSSGVEKANWIKNQPNQQIWRKKSSDKICTTSTFTQLLSKTQTLNCLSIGAKDIPICLIVNGNVAQFAALVKSLYPDQTVQGLADTIADKGKPLIVVWITGFKPHGDDSRPDRGLVPLARMLFGNDIEILTIVYGPAKPSTWKKLKNTPQSLINENGLWQAILNLSDYVIADSATSPYGALGLSTRRTTRRTSTKITLPAAHTTIAFSEHDVDTAIHSLFTNTVCIDGVRIYESMCNPPGGDWSGISFFDTSNIASLPTEYRWTSLPRVSSIQAKRPDHVLQIHTEEKLYFMVIESKLNASDLEADIGERLTAYLDELFKIAPTAQKTPSADWRLNNDKRIPIPEYRTISGGAFRYKERENIDAILIDKKLDCILSFEFKHPPEPSVLHIHCAETSAFLPDMLSRLGEKFGSGFKVQID
jgi:hypothetical protein